MTEERHLRPEFKQDLRRLKADRKWGQQISELFSARICCQLSLAERRVVGKPTRLGFHRVTFRVSNEYGMSLPVVCVVQVLDEPQTDFGPRGSFFGVSRQRQAHGAEPVKGRGV